MKKIYRFFLCTLLICVSISSNIYANSAITPQDEYEFFITANSVGRSRISFGYGTLGKRTSTACSADSKTYSGNADMIYVECSSFYANSSGAYVLAQSRDATAYNRSSVASGYVTNANTRGRFSRSYHEFYYAKELQSCNLYLEW